MTFMMLEEQIMFLLNLLHDYGTAGRDILKIYRSTVMEM